MEQNLIDIYDLIEHAIDYAFEGKTNLKFYDYLRANKVKKNEIDLFIDSSTVLELNDIIKDLDEYIEGGADNQHKQLREAYGHIPKPQARKIKVYLYGILEDAWCIVMKDDLEEGKNNLNNDETHINRGVELLLRNRRSKPDPPKTFQVKFGKMISFLKREIVFHFNFYLDIRKK